MQCQSRTSRPYLADSNILREHLMMMIKSPIKMCRTTEPNISDNSHGRSQSGGPSDLINIGGGRKSLQSAPGPAQSIRGSTVSLLVSRLISVAERDLAVTSIKLTNIQNV